MSAVLVVDSVSKKFQLQHDQSYTLKDLVVRQLTRQRTDKRIHWALRDVNFSITQGRALGIIGHNGAGKSTLLRLLCGLGRPTTGRITCHGTISGLLDLGGGFHGDMTGRENIMTGGLLSGLTRRQVLELEPEIIAFAELEQFIDQPIRTYSSGMYVRLAFSTAIHFDPTVLVIDEVLAVGDERFQQKCLDKLAAFRKAGKTLILTSHVMEQIERMCDEIVVLEEGQVVMQGHPKEAITCYYELMRQRSQKRSSQVFGTIASVAIVEGDRQGSQEASITDVRIYDETGSQVQRVQNGKGMTVELEYTLNAPVNDIALTLGIYSTSEVKCFETVVPSVVGAFGPLNTHGVVRCHFAQLPLLPDRYYINLGLYPTDWNHIFDHHWQMHNFEVTQSNGITPNHSGFVALQPQWMSNESEQDQYDRVAT